MFLFILYLQNANELLPTGMKTHLVTSLDRRIMRNLFRTTACNIVSLSGGDCYFVMR